MTVADLASTRFAYSPLAEVGLSLCRLSGGEVRGVHRAWYEAVKPALATVDMKLLGAVTPRRGLVGDFFFLGATDAMTSIETQLGLLAEFPPEALELEIREVWRHAEVSPRAQALLATGCKAPRILAEVAYEYWTVAVEPYWHGIRAVFEDDVAFRVSELTRAGMAMMVAGMHPTLTMRGEYIVTDKTCKNPEETYLDGAGMLMVPSVFGWPFIMWCTAPGSAPHLIYPARGVGKLWSREMPGTADQDPLAALLGRSRAAILVALDLPTCTTDLAGRLAQSAPAVSQHLAVLKQNGLVTSWRAGRRVLYQRTDLATSIVRSNQNPPPTERVTELPRAGNDGDWGIDAARANGHRVADRPRASGP
jgi:DNA-binding transcriptional ArsR family regulator